MDTTRKTASVNRISLGLAVLLLVLSIHRALGLRAADLARPSLQVGAPGPGRGDGMPAVDAGAAKINGEVVDRILAQPLRMRQGAGGAVIESDGGAADPDRALVYIYAALRKHPELKRLKVTAGDAIFMHSLDFAMSYDVSTKALAVWSSTDGESGFQSQYDEYRDVTPEIMREAYVNYAPEAVKQLRFYGCFNSKSITQNVNRQIR